MQNEPQLSAEMEKRLLDLLPLGLDDWIVEDIKHFLATALEEQNKRFLSQLKERKYLISKDGMAEEYLQELINDYEDILNGKGE